VVGGAIAATRRGFVFNYARFSLDPIISESRSVENLRGYGFVRRDWREPALSEFSDRAAKDGSVSSIPAIVAQPN